MTKNPTNAERVQDFGLAIFGPEWGAGLGRLTGINARTMTRIKAAAQAGKDYAAAAGVLAALAETLDALALRARPFNRTAPPVQDTKAGPESAIESMQARRAKGPERPKTLSATLPAGDPVKAARKAPGRAGVDVQIGPRQRKPGEMLKTPKGGKR